MEVISSWKPKPSKLFVKGGHCTFTTLRRTAFIKLTVAQPVKTRFLRVPKCHYRVHKRPPPDILTRHTPTSYPFRVYFNIIFPTTSEPVKCSLLHYNKFYTSGSLKYMNCPNTETTVTRVFAAFLCLFYCARSSFDCHGLKQIDGAVPPAPLHHPL